MLGRIDLTREKALYTGIRRGKHTIAYLVNDSENEQGIVMARGKSDGKTFLVESVGALPKESREEIKTRMERLGIITRENFITWY